MGCVWFKDTEYLGKLLIDSIFYICHYISGQLLGIKTGNLCKHIATKGNSINSLVHKYQILFIWFFFSDLKVLLDRFLMFITFWQSQENSSLLFSVMSN